MYFELGISATVDEYACEQGGAFFAVKDAEKSVVFYIDGLGFEFKNKWVEDGVIRWCRFFCDDAVGFYRDVTSRGIDASDPFKKLGYKKAGVRINGAEALKQIDTPKALKAVKEYQSRQ